MIQQKENNKIKSEPIVIPKGTKQSETETITPNNITVKPTTMATEPKTIDMTNFSVEVDSNSTIEVIHTVDGMKYTLEMNSLQEFEKDGTTPVKSLNDLNLEDYQLGTDQQAFSNINMADYFWMEVQLTLVTNLDVTLAIKCFISEFESVNDKEAVNKVPSDSLECQIKVDG